MNNEIESLLMAEYEKLENQTVSIKNKISIQFQIIQIKIDTNRTKYKCDISIDLKNLIYYYLKLDDTAQFYYDHVNFASFKELIKLIPHDYKVKAIDFFIKLLRTEFHNEYIEILRKLKTDIILKNALSKPYKFKNAYQIVTYAPLYNVYTMLLTLCLFYCLFFLFSLPAFNEKFIFFSIKYSTYSDIFLLNHFLNTLSYVTGLESEFKITPTTINGLVLLIMCKIFVVLILTNSIFIKITEYLKK